MSKPTVNAKEAAADIRSGMNNAALMEKYRVTETGLRSLMTKLVKAGLLEQSELDARLPGIPPAASEPWTCPACGYLQLEKPSVCPQCGFIVAKSEEKQAAPPEKSAIPESQSAADKRGGESPPRSRSSEMQACPHCSKQIRADAAKCKYCGKWLKPETEEEEDDWGTKYCPWEDRERLGVFEAIKQTVAGVLFSPTQFFSQLPPSGGLTQPLFFGLILGSAGLIMSQIWTALFQTGQGGSLGMLLVWIILSPIFVAIALFVGAAVAHLCLAIVGAANEEYEATFRVYSYVQAAQVWHVFPMVGAFVSLVWSMVAAVIGLREVHATTTGKAVLAILLPVLVCCGISLMAAWFIGLAAFSALMHAR